jgi:hypothetical protein
MKKSLFILLLSGILVSSQAYSSPRLVRVGVFPAAPLVLIEGGKPDGLFIDLIEYFSRNQGWTISYVQGTWE